MAAVDISLMVKLMTVGIHGAVVLTSSSVELAVNVTTFHSAWTMVVGLAGWAVVAMLGTADQATKGE